MFFNLEDTNTPWNYTERCVVVVEDARLQWGNGREERETMNVRILFKSLRSWAVKGKKMVVRGR